MALNSPAFAYSREIIIGERTERGLSLDVSRTTTAEQVKGMSRVRKLRDSLRQHALTDTVVARGRGERASGSKPCLKVVMYAGNRHEASANALDPFAAA